MWRETDVFGYTDMDRFIFKVAVVGLLEAAEQWMSLNLYLRVFQTEIFGIKS